MSFGNTQITGSAGSSVMGTPRGPSPAGAPLVTPQAAAGRNATATVGGGDSSGTVTVTTGPSSVTAGVLVNLVFSQTHLPYGVALIPANGAAQAAGLYVTGVTPDGFSIAAGTAPPVSTPLIIMYGTKE